ncbi:FAH family protein [Duganella sp. BJB488]|uniref:AraD1 family protein n=1 Tax=unclassified Duganella TaxID=2636909 RepID=UPI000E343107|nr:MULTISPECIES: AraD1 family protein [unclassified Duganella]NVD69900.1 FAH family protein [Duganella sp. BJB1802]RFP09383.1 FAH family protein [Duganella sp. BJB489]RFP13094.1 FAH family protein [Duganella sp. BJB488]RFP29177.1 FAH family protein [Duganella sp. BJB480]
MLLVQFKNEQGARQIGVLEQNTIRVIEGYDTTYALAQAAIRKSTGLADLAAQATGSAVVAFDAVAAAGRLLPPLDHSDDAHCYVTGTGLTHLGSADTRDAMHKKIGGDVASLSDSMKMFRMGVEGGKPAAGQAGVQPEWFYKGDGSIVAASGQALNMPDFALDGGEEPEVAGLYVIGDDGQPYRVGYAIGNEFSDHVTERQNYLYLAHSKLRACGLGPALLVGEAPAHIEGTSRIYDVEGKVRWEKAFFSGEQNMSHTIANLEHHHFKYPLFKRPGDVHIHFFGTATLSVADNIVVKPGETFEIEAPQFGPALRNKLAVYKTEVAKVKAL